MPKKKTDDTSHLEHPDYDKISTIEECDEYIAEHEQKLVGKDKTESKIKHEKREYTKALNEQLKELNEEREHEIGVLSALDDRKRVLSAQSNVVPMNIPRPATR